MNYKELFRAQLLRKKESVTCLLSIDNDKFSSGPAIGCFKINSQYDDQYIVYYVDERDRIEDVKVHYNPKDAYSDLANRLGFTFETENIVDYAKLFMEQLSKQPKEVQKLCSLYAGNYLFNPIPYLNGCFQSEEQWIVYKYDENCVFESIKIFSDPEEAYSLLAKQLGFTFEI